MDYKSPAYKLIHTWIGRNYGKADHCTNCGTKEAKRYQWALIPGKTYERKIDNFIQMCTSCHKQMDLGTTTHCRNGHEKNEINYKVSKTNGEKRCLLCFRDRNRVNRANKKITNSDGVMY